MSQTNKNIRIAIACNRKLFQEFFCIALKEEPHIEIIAALDDLSLAVDNAREHKPDVLLLDITQSEYRVEEIIGEIKTAFKGARVLVVAIELNDDSIESYVRAGARGYISTKHSSKAGVVSAIKAVHRGEFWIERKLTAKLLEGKYRYHYKTDGRPRNPKQILTERELEIIRHLAQGYSNKEIASVLSISDKTVKSHINNIFKKLNVNRRIEALLFAIRHGLLQKEDTLE